MTRLRINFGEGSGEQALQLMEKALQAAWRHFRFEHEMCVDVTFCGDEEIRELNKSHRNVDRHTDVLSFPMEDFYQGRLQSPVEMALSPQGELFLGDIIINLQQAQKQGEEFGHGFERECAYLTVHSFLHLIGFDHEDEGEEKRVMRGMEEEILMQMDSTQDIRKTGIFSVVGRPNAGKSTLVNRLCGNKVAIVSPKPQTTRTRITGIANIDDYQMVFLDTPGFHAPKTSLGEYMVRVVNSTVSSVDTAILVVEPVANVGEPEAALIKKIKEYKIPSILVINKTDTVKNAALLEVLAVYQAEHDFDAFVPISALKGDGVQPLLEELKKQCFESPPLFPEGMISDQPEKQIAAEVVREKMLFLLDKEVPHGIAIEIERMAEREDGIIDVEATIYCERKSHKGIIIGKNGAMLKEIGTRARKEMEQVFGTKVFLQLWVKIREGWRNNPAQLRNFGYDKRSID